MSLSKRSAKDRMPPPTSVPYYSTKEVSRKAEFFLHKYHPLLRIPVPIEEIIEFDFQIDIVPIHGLHRSFEIDGFTSNDLTTISVDAFLQESRPGRYRFTLAHEIGHVFLHRDFFRQSSFKSIEEWKNFTQSISPREYGIIEWQAYQFAGFILVPPQMLKSKWQEAIAIAKEKGVLMGKRIEPATRQYLANWLAKQFLVSSEVIERCIDRDKL
jgi:hypothetical protein